MTRERLSVQMKPNHATDSSRLGVTAIVTTTESYDVLVGVPCCIRWVFKWIIRQR
jgi:hypothetical protein